MNTNKASYLLLLSLVLFLKMLRKLPRLFLKSQSIFRGRGSLVVIGQRQNLW